MELRSLSMLSVVCFTLLSCTSTSTNFMSDRLFQATAVTHTPSAIADATAQANQQPIITSEMVDELCLTMTLLEVEAILGQPEQLLRKGSS